MFIAALILALAGAIVLASARLQRPDADYRVTVLLLVGYAVRLAISPFTRDLPVFTRMAEDYASYEENGYVIARLWQYTGISFVTEIGGEPIQVALPSNVFACVIYINGERTHLGCVAVVAAVACFVCLEVYLVSRLLGASRDAALGITGVAASLPSFLFYTSNTFKDGFVALFVLGVFGCAVRLSRKFSIVQVALAVGFLGCLWFTRFYLVFIVPPPLLLGLLGLRSQSIWRTAIATGMIVASVSALYAYSNAPDVVVHHATRTFAGATSQDILDANAEGGSGVTFDTGSPTAAFIPKLVYTLFSPFPWQPGSLGLQIAKIEALAWYYLFYRAVRSAKSLWRERRFDLLMFGSLIVPMTVAYAFSFSNIGLIVRQRMDIMLATMVLSALSWAREDDVPAARPLPSGGALFRS